MRLIRHDEKGETLVGKKLGPILQELSV